MTVLTHIEAALKEINGAVFEKLCGVYLYKKGYENITVLGSVIGADKSRIGIPDAFSPLPTGKFVFAAYTTQQQGLFAKLTSDIDDCFNPEKTGLSQDQIEEIVLCFNSILKPEEQSELLAKCQSHGVKCSLYGMSAIANDFYQKYPKLTHDFLGIDVDTGQIVDTEDFVTIHDKSRLAVRLDTKFHFRSQELEDVTKALDESDLLIVTGKPGVGKSRLALEACRQIKSANQGIKTWCILNRGPDIYRDLHFYFDEPGNYLIMVDDANRLTGFKYLVDLLMNRREDQNIKIILTVRDYALEKILELTSQLTSVSQIEIQPFPEDEIKNLVRDEYGIKDQTFLERIYEISKGNVRLAVMAAEVVNREHTYTSINNVASLYDEYFQSIRHDLQKIGEEDLLKIAGTVSFFRHIDRANDDLMKDIYQAFTVSEEQFWKAVKTLHELEIFDMYEDEVVRFSDQVLATYLFYLAFFKEKILDFAVLINTSLFPRFRSKLVDSINPVLSNFDTKEIIDFMLPIVEAKWDQIKDYESIETLHLLEVFWFINLTRTLSHIQKVISKMVPTTLRKDVDLEEIKPETSLSSPSILNLISYFEHVDDENFEIAVRLVLDLLEKNPNDVGKVLYVLADRFSFNGNSVNRGYSNQRIVTDVLWERADEGRNELFTRLYIGVSEQNLRTRYHVTEAKGHHAIIWYDFQLRPLSALKDIRNNMLKRLFLLSEQAKYNQKIMNIIEKYTKSGIDIDVKEIIEEDAELMIPFIGNLDSSEFSNCILAHNYFDFLESHDISVPEELKGKFTTEIYATYELLEYDRLERKNLGLSYDEFEALRKKSIKEKFATLSFEEGVGILEHCKQICGRLAGDNKLYQIRVGLLIGLEYLATINMELFDAVICDYLDKGDQLNLYQLTDIAVKTLGAVRSIEIINGRTFDNKPAWLFNYYITLPESEILKEDLNNLYSLYEDAELHHLSRDLDYLLKFKKYDSQILIKVSEIILKKADKEPRYIHAFSFLFHRQTDINKYLIELYSGRDDLLKKIYLLCLEVEQYFDYDGLTFCRIMEVDPNFANEYIDYMFSKNKWLSKHDDHRDYSPIWLRDDFMEVMDAIVVRIYDHEKAHGPHTYLEAFFTIRKESKNREEIIKGQDTFISDLIKKRKDDINFIPYIFDLLSEETFSFDRMIKALSIFLALNKDIEFFNRISLLPSSFGWTGSAVPVHQKRAEDLEKVLHLVGTVELLQHKLEVEERIAAERRQVEAGKKKDFMDQDL